MKSGLLSKCERRGEVVEQIELALEKKNLVPMYYAGGTLCIDIADDEIVMCNFDDDGMTDYEKRLIAQMYVNNKTSKHSFYRTAKRILAS